MIDMNNSIFDTEKLKISELGREQQKIVQNNHKKKNRFKNHQSISETTSNNLLYAVSFPKGKRQEKSDKTRIVKILPIYENQSTDSKNLINLKHKKHESKALIKFHQSIK